MLIETRDGATMILTLNQPARRNALALAMREAMVAALQRIAEDRSVRAVVITGAGGHFCAGGDISGMDVTDLGAGLERFSVSHRLVRALIDMDRPVVAAVDGWAAGAGVGLALCCDTIVAAEDSHFATPFGRIGLVGDFALFHTLPRRIGEGRARQMLLSGDAIDAATAERWGLVDHLAPPGKVLEKALERAAKLAQSAPLATALTKAKLAEGLADLLGWERTVQSALFATADHQEGKAAFLGKRAPVFKGA